MVGEELIGQGMDINMSEIYSSLWNSMPPSITNNMDKIVELGVILIISSIAYLAFLILIKIIGLFFGSRESRRLKRISEQLDEIIGVLKKGDKGKKRAGGNFKK